MTEKSPPVACSLGAADLRRRLDEIAAVGSESLRARQTDGATQILRFDHDATTRRALERIIAAETECCPFLDFDLREEGRDLVLRIAASADGAPVASELARAFGEP